MNISITSYVINCSENTIWNIIMLGHDMSGSGAYEERSSRIIAQVIENDSVYPIEDWWKQIVERVMPYEQQMQQSSIRYYKGLSCANVLNSTEPASVVSNYKWQNTNLTKNKGWPKTVTISFALFMCK